jgi:predicted Zn-dependent peptidase
VSSRLFQNIREKRGLVYSIATGLNLYRDAGAMVVFADMAPKNATRVVDLTMKELKKLRKDLVPEEELSRVKENIKGSIMLSLESSSSRMMHLAQQLMYFGRCSPLEEILGRIDRVTAEEIRDLANRVFHSSSMTLTALGSKDGRELESITMSL